MAFPEPTLPDAATNIVADLYPRWLAASNVTTGIKPTATAFYTALATTFANQAPGGHPCANLIAIIAAMTTNLPAPSASNVPMLNTFMNLVLTIYKLLWMTYQLSTQSPAQITSAQATAVLAAYNTAFNV